MLKWLMPSLTLSRYTKGISTGIFFRPLVLQYLFERLILLRYRAKLSNYADDNQLTSSDIAPSEVQAVLIRNLGVTSKWFLDWSDPELGQVQTPSFAQTKK